MHQLARPDALVSGIQKWQKKNDELLSCFTMLDPDLVRAYGKPNGQNRSCFTLQSTQIEHCNSTIRGHASLGECTKAVHSWYLPYRLIHKCVGLRYDVGSANSGMHAKDPAYLHSSSPSSCNGDVLYGDGNFRSDSTDGF